MVKHLSLKQILSRAKNPKIIPFGEYHVHYVAERKEYIIEIRKPKKIYFYSYNDQTKIILFESTGLY